MPKIWKSPEEPPKVAWETVAAVDQDGDFVLCYYGNGKWHYRGEHGGVFEPKKWAYTKDLIALE